MILKLNLRLKLCRAGVVGALLLACACVSATEEDDGDELKDEELKLDVPWEDLTSQLGTDLHQQVAPVKTPQGVPAVVKAHVLSQVVPQASKMHLVRSAAFAGGELGWVGSAKAFVAPVKMVPDDHHLYWVMVRVLSEKYSCFMTAKQTSGARLLVHCADGRKVLFRRERGPDFVQFQARQYDQDGYEILVKKHRKVRVAGAVGLGHALAMGI